MMSEVRQTTSDIFLVRPARFGPNEQTAASNAFRRPIRPSELADAQFAALAEFDAMADRLRRADINVIVFADTPDPPKPDALFPNNWITTHDDGTVILYPMEAENRRFERRDDIVEQLSTQHHFHIGTITDLTAQQTQGKYLEGTGSLVLDRVHRVGYAALSSRTDPEVLGEFAQLAGYEIIAFPTAGPDGCPIYHTNVMMSIGSRFAVVCAVAIVDADKRRAVLRRITESGRQLIEISPAQTKNFAGNIVELATRTGDATVAMSRSAHDSLSSAQLEILGRHARVLALPIDTIEKVGGGSVRCMVAEIFLPRGESD